MLVVSERTRRLVVRCLAWSMVAFAVTVSPVAVGAVAAPMASASAAEPMDCEPVGVETRGDTIYYVENCYGYNVYRVLQ